MTKKTLVSNTKEVPMTEDEVLLIFQREEAAKRAEFHAQQEEMLRNRPSIPKRSSKADRHHGITLRFTTNERARLQLLAKHYRKTASHVLRLLIEEDCNRIWPNGIVQAQLDSALFDRSFMQKRSKQYAREKEAERLRKMADELRERQLLVEEDLRRMQEARRSVATSAADVRRSKPRAPSTNAKVEEWFEERAEKKPLSTETTDNKPRRGRASNEDRIQAAVMDKQRKERRVLTPTEVEMIAKRVKSTSPRSR